MAMRRKKAAAILPKPWPYLFTVGLWQLQTTKRGTGEKLKPPLGMRLRQRFQLCLHLKQKHQPMRPALITMFADETGQMQIHRAHLNAEFLPGLAAGAGIRRFADVHFQLAAARTPETAIRLPRALKQQYLIPLIEAVKQRGDFVRQCHQTEFQISSAECRGRKGASEDTPPVASRSERGVYAASSFGSPKANRFVHTRSRAEAA